MERRWFYLALLSIGCLGPCDGYAQSTEQAPDTMEVRIMAVRPAMALKAKGPTTPTSRAWPANPPGTLPISFSRSTRGGGTIRQ
jgi:hypothetical protein